MPRIHNTYDYFSSERRPAETILDFPVTDSVRMVTLNFERSDDERPDFVQVRRHNGTWEVVTNLDIHTVSEPERASGSLQKLSDRFKTVMPVEPAPTPKK